MCFHCQFELKLPAVGASSTPPRPSLRPPPTTIIISGNQAEKERAIREKEEIKESSCLFIGGIRRGLLRYPTRFLLLLLLRLELEAPARDRDPKTE